MLCGRPAVLGRLRAPRQVARGLAGGQEELPAEAEVVVVGGGAAATSTAFHLARAGAGRGLLLLEAEKLTAGTTWHSAAMVNSLSFGIVDAKLRNHTKQLIGQLEEETGVNPGYKVHGGLTVATTPAHMDQFRRELDIASYTGNVGAMVTPEQAGELLPHLHTADLLGGIYSSTDGSVDPTGLTMAYARGAALGGGRVVEGCPVTRVLVEDGRVVGVETPRGRVATKRVVIAAGAWSKALGKEAGASLPMEASEHSYIVTDIIPNLGNIPNLRVPEDSIYTKVQNETLYLGAFEANPRFWEPQPGFAFGLFDLNMEAYMPYLEAIHRRLPMLDNVGHKTIICGPESFTPDSMPLFGETPEVRGLFLNCAMNSRGIQLSGGMGREMALLLTRGTTSLNMHGYDIKRFHGKLRRDADWALERTQERHLRTYWPPFPTQQPLAARGRFLSPLHHSLADRGAFFCESGGWERAQFFLPEEGTEALRVEPYDWYGYYGHTRREGYRYRQVLSEEYAAWSYSDRVSAAIGREARACREDIVLFDNSSFGKLMVEGPGAGAALDWLCTNRVVREEGRTVYTLMLNLEGGIEADLTVTRLGPEQYYLVTGTAALQHVTWWLDTNLPQDVSVRDVTKDWGVLNLQGPRSRQLLEPLVPGLASLPFSRCRRAEVAGVEVLVVRITYVGELGYELHVPSSACGRVLAALEEGGALQFGGMEAMESLAMEKGYQHWPADIQTCDSPLEAGMGWVCRMGKPFLGRDALREAKQGPLAKQLVHLSLDPGAEVQGGEPILHGDTVVGYVRRAGTGYSVGRVLAFGYAEAEGLGFDGWALQVSGERVEATRHRTCVYDPEGTRIKGSAAD